jgi:hypothetical protein
LDNVITGTDFLGDYLVILRVMAQFGLTYWAEFLVAGLLFFFIAGVFYAIHPSRETADRNLGYRIFLKMASYCVVYLLYALIYKVFFL